jgi:hypothetical protein
MTKNSKKIMKILKIMKMMKNIFWNKIKYSFPIIFVHLEWIRPLFLLKYKNFDSCILSVNNSHK